MGPVTAEIMEEAMIRASNTLPDRMILTLSNEQIDKLGIRHLLESRRTIMEAEIKKLGKMKKEKLVEIGLSLGLTFDENYTKQTMAEYIAEDVDEMNTMITASNNTVSDVKKMGSEDKVSGKKFLGNHPITCKPIYG